MLVEVAEGTDDADAVLVCAPASGRQAHAFAPGPIAPRAGPTLLPTVFLTNTTSAQAVSLGTLGRGSGGSLSRTGGRIY